ncbi:unnamed protein product [Vitrella brassicaformis CCMP3155]|uniref:Aspartyl/asparaginy/proline hydroxylase domain-containing protein n=1 Tax=Vitrella brassicaformis (strain CCMP3155) TaxID=1169540 RepID=A0A0G4GUD4_VITBC|nr:unnamed protein product [Vitrella brassicaformis CCMP3155]|eukprot:CEM34449.1 unnamed protein product [Vitrella brassicaformis CCMP3155]
MLFNLFQQPKRTRKEMFWERVEQTLRSRYRFREIRRIYDFIDYCNGNLQPPVAATLHCPSEEFVPRLTAQPWWDPADFPWTAQLERQSPVIQEELRSALDQPREYRFAANSAMAQTMGAGWSAFRLQRFGEWIEDNRQKFPRTSALLADLGIPIAMRGVMIARQRAGSGVQPHSDGRNFILTAHLGLQVPEGCWMRVGEERREWRENKVCVFDTSFEHETGNPTQHGRFVLIVDFWHPELSDAERNALADIYAIRNEFDREVLAAAEQEPVNGRANGIEQKEQQQPTEGEREGEKTPAAVERP